MGLFSWIASRPKSLKEYGKKVVGAEQIKENAGFIADMAKSLKPTATRYETFENAKARLGLSEKDLEETYKYYTTRFNIFVFFFGIGLVVFAYYLMSLSWSAVPVIGFLAVCVAQLFAASFRMYQIRRRELVVPMEWFRAPHEWWVKPFNAQQETSNVVPLRKSNPTVVSSGKKK